MSRFIKQVLLEIDRSNYHNIKMSETIRGWLAKAEEAILLHFKIGYVNENKSTKVVDDDSEINKVSTNNSQKVIDEKDNFIYNKKTINPIKVQDSFKAGIKSSSYRTDTIKDCNNYKMKIKKL